MNITAAEAGGAMITIATKLLEAQIVAPEGYSVLHRWARKSPDAKTS